MGLIHDLGMKPISADTLTELLSLGEMGVYIMTSTNPLLFAGFCFVCVFRFCKGCGCC